jgi:hypothetical protein
MRPSRGRAGRGSAGSVGVVLTGAYRELLPAIAATAAALTGLLFVAMTVARQGPLGGSVVIQQVRAAASILAFTNALAVSLFGLVPGNNAGYPAIVVAVIGIFFAAAGARSILSGRLPWRHLPRQVAFISLLLTIFGFELAAGIDLLLHPYSAGAAELVSDLLIALLLVGIARAWELVGDRDTGIVASIAVLAGHDRHPGDHPSRPDDHPSRPDDHPSDRAPQADRDHGSPERQA